MSELNRTDTKELVEIIEAIPEAIPEANVIPNSFMVMYWNYTDPEIKERWEKLSEEIQKAFRDQDRRKRMSITDE